MSRCNFPGFSFEFAFPALSLDFDFELPLFELAFDLPCPLD